MDNMVNYIFSSMHATEQVVGGVLKNLKKQKKFNKRVAMFTAIAAIYITDNRLKIIKQEAKIKALNTEIESLKEDIEELGQTKGE